MTQNTNQIFMLFENISGMSLILWILVGYILLRTCLPDIVSEDQFSVQVSSGVSASLAVRYVPVLTSCVDLGQRRQVYCVLCFSQHWNLGSREL